MHSIGCLDPRTYPDFNVENGNLENVSVKPTQNGLSIQRNQFLVGSLVGDSFGTLPLSSLADKGYLYSAALCETALRSINPRVWITNPAGANDSYNSTGIAAGDSISVGFTYSQSPEQATSNHHNSGIPLIFNRANDCLMVDGACSLFSANYRSTRHDLIFAQAIEETRENKESEQNGLMVMQSPTRPIITCDSANRTNDYNAVCSLFTAANRSVRCDLISLVFSLAIEETCEQIARDMVMNSLTRPIDGCIVGNSSNASEEYDSNRKFLSFFEFASAIEQSHDLIDELEHLVMQSLNYVLESNNHHIQFDDVKQANSCSSDCEQVLMNPSPHFLKDSLHSFVCYRPTPLLQEYYRQESSDNQSIQPINHTLNSIIDKNIN